jgi:hypothetical protein
VKVLGSSAAISEEITRDAATLSNEESNNLEASGGKQIDDLLNGIVGAVVGGFEFARWLVSGIWAVMEAAVGERSAQPFVEEEEEQGYL